MDNKRKKSKAFLIATIVILLIVLGLYLVYQNKNSFGVKTSSVITKMFSPLIPSENAEELTVVQAGEDISKGDNVSLSTASTKDNIIVLKTVEDGDVYGTAYEDISAGDVGKIIKKEQKKANKFIDSFSSMLDNLFNKKVDNGYGGSYDNNGYGNNYTQPSFTSSASNGPDLVVSSLYPSYVTAGVSQVFTAVVSNIGNANAGDSYVTFQYSDKYNGAGKISEADEKAGLSSILAGKNDTVQWEHTFNNGETPSIRACVDTNKSVNTYGDVKESNEDNNCGEWVTITISNGSNSIPSSTSKADLIAYPITPTTAISGIVQTFTSVITNQGMSSADKMFPYFFQVSSNENGENASDQSGTEIGPLNTSSSINATFSYTFKSTGTYYVRSCADKSSSSDNGVISESNEDNNCSSWTKITVSESTNKCALIDANPLTFTDAEESTLAELLRKYYLIAPTLKTEDDITVIYKQMENYKAEVENVDSLINQCYAETKTPGEGGTYTGPTTRGGNPWYNYGNRSSYLKTQDSSGSCSGSISSQYNEILSAISLNIMIKGGSISPNQLITELQTCSSLYRNKSSTNCLYGSEGYSNSETGCSWNSGNYMQDYEKILNIW